MIVERSQTSDARYEQGMKTLRALGSDADRLVSSLADIAPDFSRFIIEFAFGEIYSRSGLDLKTRELATIAALAALGTAPGQLKVHIHGALDVGCTKTEIVEILMQMSLYSGIPAALNGLTIAEEVLRERVSGVIECGAAHGS